MPKLTDLPDEVLARIFSAVLGTPADCCEFGARASPRAEDALALARTCMRTWRAFALCLARVRIDDQNSEWNIRSLVRASGRNLRALELSRSMPARLLKSRNAAKFLGIIATDCTSLIELAFDARYIRIAYCPCTPDDNVTAMRIILQRLHVLKATGCAVPDLDTICAEDMDYSRLRSLHLTVQNIYEANENLCKLWNNVGRKLQVLRLGVIESSLAVRAHYPILGDGLSGFSQLYERRLDLRLVEFANLKIRAFVAAHRLLVEPTGKELRTIVLSKCHVWPLLVTKLCESPALKDLRIEGCWLDEADVPAVVRSSANCLTSFWRNTGHWHGPEQVQTLKMCKQLTKLDLACVYDGAPQDVLQVVQMRGRTVREARVGGTYFEVVDVLNIVKEMPKLETLYVFNVRLELQHVQHILELLDKRVQGLFFDNTSDDWHVGDLFALVRRAASNIHYLGFPSKLRDAIPVPDDLPQPAKDAHRLALCGRFLRDIQQLPNLDINALRESLIRGVAAYE